MSEGTFESVSEEDAAKLTGDDRLEAEGKRLQADADGVEQDETERYSFPPDEGQNQGDGTGQDGSGNALDDVDLEPPSS